MKVKLIIPSRRRPDSVPRMEAMFPGALWCLDKEDAKTYPVERKRILIQPPTTIGLPRTRQWILDTVPDEIVGMLDDDVQFMFVNCGKVGRRIYDPDQIRKVIENGALMAKELGTSLFGFSKQGDVRKFTPTQPFNLCTWIAGFMGFVGRKIRFATHLKSRADMDFALRVLEKDRFVLCDNRFAFVYDSFRRPGGMTLTRTADTDRMDMVLLKKDWGPYIEFHERTMGLTPSFNVTRRQPLHLNNE